ncbi:MAG: hypothetical protein ACPGU9_00705 [Flavobacteriaceae bacterium]
MKTICMYLLVLGLVCPAFAQEKNYEELYESGKLPAVVLKKAGEEFSVYYPDNKNPDSRVLALENSFISYTIDKDFNGTESYYILFEVKDGVLAANFDENGKLLSVVERFKNVRIPEKVRQSLALKFPEWSMKSDKFVYVQKKGEVKRKHYKIIMKKNNKLRRIVVNEHGELL